MESVPLIYPEFKAVVLSKKLWWQYYPKGNQYVIYATDDGKEFTTAIYLTDPGIINFNWELEQTYLADFNAEYKDSANRPVSLSPTAAQSQFVGKTIELEAGATSGYCEWSFDADVYINKVLPLPEDSVFGDTLDFEVWAKASDMGVDPVIVTRYAESIPLTSNKTWPWVTGSGGGKIPSYCTVRCYYRKDAGAARKFGVMAEFLI